jgi:hypothetical protein
LPKKVKKIEIEKIEQSDTISGSHSLEKSRRPVINFQESIEDTIMDSVEDSAIRRITDPISRQVALTEARIKREQIE